MSIISRFFSAAHNLELASIEVPKCFYLLSVGCSESSSKIKDAEMRGAGRVGSKLCALDHDRLRGGRDRSRRRVSELGQKPFCDSDGEPAEC